MNKSQQNASVWILGDQLLTQHPALETAEQQYSKAQLTVVLIESKGRATQHPYQRKKLVLLFSAMRHYAEQLREQGFTVDYIKADRFVEGLKQHIERYKPATLFTMAASAYHGRRFQQHKLSDQLGLPVHIVPNSQFLLGRYNPIPKPQENKRYVMEHFYRHMRRHFNILIDGKGQWGVSGIMTKTTAGHCLRKTGRLKTSFLSQTPSHGMLWPKWTF